MRRITVDHPRARDHEIEVRWRVEPQTPLYRAERFSLRFPERVQVGGMPPGLLWTLALLCLHSHWPLLRPCRVELPIELPAGEREFWLRLCDSGVATLELTYGGTDLERTIEIADRGPRLADPPPAGERAGAVTALSGGKDSLLALGLLTELDPEPPIAVTTTSPMEPLFDQQTPRRRAILDAIAARDDLELVEVDSDFRASWENDFPRRGRYQLSVNELSDTFLYLAAAAAVAWARGRERVLLASEAEPQESTVVDGHTVQHPHYMYSAATQRAVDALLSRHGLRHGSLNYPLYGWQVEQLLWQRYPDLRRLQYSCWRVRDGDPACNWCSDCLRIALTAIAADTSPRELGIDLPLLIERMREWKPVLPAGPEALPDVRVRSSIHAHVVRQLARTPPRAVARRIAVDDPRFAASRRLRDAVRGYRELRRRVIRASPPSPVPGYRSAYLELVDPALRDRLAAIYDGAFPRAPTSEDRELATRTRALAAWIAAPLNGGA